MIERREREKGRERAMERGREKMRENYKPNKLSKDINVSRSNS